LLQEHGEDLNLSVGACYADSRLEKDTFTVVADIGSNGELENVVVEPESDPARCYAQRISRLRVTSARPEESKDAPYPLVIRVNFNK
jgi:hypothetical protein